MKLKHYMQKYNRGQSMNERFETVYIYQSMNDSIVVNVNVWCV